MNRSSLARINEQQPHELYEALFGKLLARCQALAPRHGFRFKNKLYSLDASTIDLCLSVFPWAKFRTTKGAIKLHVGLDHEGYLPTFMQITDGKVQEVNMARTLNLPSGSLVVFDRGYTDYTWYNHLIGNKVYLVTRQKKNACYTVIERHSVSGKSGITSDQTIRLTGTKAEQCPALLRRVGYRDSETGKHYVFLTNAFHLSAKTIAAIYKERWQIELFFKMDQAEPEMDQAEPEDQKLPGHITQCRTDANLGGNVHIPATCLYQIHEPARPWHATDTAPAPT